MWRRELKNEKLHGRSMTGEVSKGSTITTCSQSSLRDSHLYIYTSTSLYTCIHVKCSGMGKNIESTVS